MSKTVSIINNCVVIITAEESGFFYGEVWKDGVCVGEGSLGKNGKVTPQDLYDTQFAEDSLYWQKNE